jgi:hypothetical protein
MDLLKECRFLQERFVAAKDTNHVVVVSKLINELCLCILIINKVHVD